MLFLNRTIRRKTVATFIITTILIVVSGMGLLIVPALAQAPPSYPPSYLDRLVSRIALYPDPLLAQVLAASTFPDEVPDAASWADQHHYLTGDTLAGALSEDQLPWDPSVQALIPFPSVLYMMASDMNWTSELGNAFLAQPQDVMDAVQRMRQRARDFGYLRSNRRVVVSGPTYIGVMPTNPGFICVPYYDPLVVFARPRPGFVVSGAINFGFGVTIGAAFRPWGWGANRFVWNSHTVIISDYAWNRRWVNRTTYVHHYAVQRHEERRIERHQLQECTHREREAWHGHKRVEEHRRHKEHRK